MKKVKFVETESRKVVARGKEVANVSSVIGCVESGDLVYNMVTIINSTLLYTQKIVERVDLKCYHHKHKKAIM